MAEGYVELKALGRRRVVDTLGWNYHAFGRTALLLDEARHDGIAAHRFDEIGEANYGKALALAEPGYALARHIAAWVSASSTDAQASRLGRPADCAAASVLMMSMAAVKSTE